MPTSPAGARAEPFPEETYGPYFSAVYNMEWRHAVLAVCPALHEFAAHDPVAGSVRRVLDVCSGTGQLACYFADRGFEVTGVDASPEMIRLARANAETRPSADRIRFLEQDVTKLEAGSGFGLAISTCDSMNHIVDSAALAECFARVRRALVPGAAYIFDMHTPSGLRHLNNIQVRETREMMFVARTVFDPSADRLVARVSGCWHDGRAWQRFAHSVQERAYEPDVIIGSLHTAGFAHAYAAEMAALGKPLACPADAPRVSFVARTPQ